MHVYHWYMLDAHVYVVLAEPRMLDIGFIADQCGAMEENRLDHEFRVH